MRNDECSSKPVLFDVDVFIGFLPVYFCAGNVTVLLCILHWLLVPLGLASYSEFAGGFVQCLVILDFFDPKGENKNRDDRQMELESG